MKKLHALLFNSIPTTITKMSSLLLISLFSVAALQAQTAVNVVPNGFYQSTGGESRTIFPNTFASSKVQMPLYNNVLSSVGLTPGTEIVGIQWEVSLDNTPATSIYDIAMSNAYSGEVIAAGSNIPFLDLPFTTVATGAEDPGQYTGTHTMMFDTPFTWNGTNHLVMQVCRTSVGQGATDETLNTFQSGISTIITHYNSDCNETIAYYGERYGTVITFLVNIAPPACTPPANVQHTLESPARCVITWDETAEATKYDVLYRVKGTTTWDRIGALSNYRTLRGLAENTIYQYKVRSYCGSWDFSNATDIRQFNTANIPMPINRLGTTDTEAEITSIHPNPAQDIVNVEFFTETQSDITLSIRDLTGKLVYQNEINNVEGSQNEAIDVSKLGAGYYMVIMQSAEKREVKKFVIAR